MRFPRAPKVEMMILSKTYENDFGADHIKNKCDYKMILVMIVWMMTIMQAYRMLLFTQIELCHFFMVFNDFFFNFTMMS